MEIAQLLNNHLKQYWLECNFSAIQNIVKGIEKIDNETLLLVLTKEKQFVDVDGGLDLIDDTPEEQYSVNSIYEILKYTHSDLISRIVGYSMNMANAYDVSDKDDFEYYWKLLQNYQSKLIQLKKDYIFFQELTSLDIQTDDDILSEYWIESKLEDAQSDIEEVKDYISKHICSTYEEAVKKYLSELNFKHLYVMNRLSLEKNYTALNILQITGTNGIYHLPEHRTAQEECEKLRGDDIFPENILDCIWNSGWLASDGSFYGCSDLGHVLYSRKLIEYLEKQDKLTSDHCDDSRRLELSGYIKFSEGRWLYMKEDFSPSKNQLQVILEWATEKAGIYKVCFGDVANFIGLDLLESKIKYAK